MYFINLGLYEQVDLFVSYVSPVFVCFFVVLLTEALPFKAILSVADLEKVSVKKIRRAIQELFAIDLDPHKVCST